MREFPQVNSVSCSASQYGAKKRIAPYNAFATQSSGRATHFQRRCGKRLVCVITQSAPEASLKTARAGTSPACAKLGARTSLPGSRAGRSATALRQRAKGERARRCARCRDACAPHPRPRAVVDAGVASCNRAHFAFPVRYAHAARIERCAGLHRPAHRLKGCQYPRKSLTGLSRRSAVEAIAQHDLARRQHLEGHVLGRADVARNRRRPQRGCIGRSRHVAGLQDAREQ